MQCLARTVARSARAAAEGYGGQRFASTGSCGASAAKAYYIRQRRVALRDRMRLANVRHHLQWILAKLEALDGRLAKLEPPQGIVGFMLRRSPIISGLVIGQVLFGSSSTSSSKEKEVNPNNT